MAQVGENPSESSATSHKEARAPPRGNYSLVSAVNERRRAALEDIDNATFSYVLFNT